MNPSQITNISFIIPCYNEGPLILAKTVAEIRSSINTNYPDFQYEILIVNDGSTKYDYSPIEGCTFLQHETNRGYGAALKTGIKSAQFDWIAITDSDSTYPNHRFHELIAAGKNVDMIIGARPWGNISKMRLLPKLVLTYFASFLAGYKIEDLNSGMRIFRKALAREFWPLFPNGFSFTSTITMASLTNNYEVKFFKIDYFKREGKSSIKPIQDTWRFFNLVTRLALYFNPTRFFMPVSFIFLLAAIARGSRDYLLNQHLGGLSLLLFHLAIQIFFFGLIAEIISKSRFAFQSKQ